MPVTVTEAYEVELHRGQQPSGRASYNVMGTEDAVTAADAAQAAIPTTFDGLLLDDIAISRLGSDVWKAEASYAPYARREALEPGDETDPWGDSVWEFDTSGGTQHITQSIDTFWRGGPNGNNDCQDYHGAIGVADGEVEGIDVTIPVFSWSETHAVNAAGITDAYRKVISELTGRFNIDAFRTFQPSEVLFLGAQGTKRGSEHWLVTYKFAASPNALNLQVDDILIPFKRGWDYLWVDYEDTIEDGFLTKKPLGAYVEQVYRDGDFNQLLIGS